MKVKIENIDDLRLEIGRLELQCVQHEAVLSYRLKSLVNKFSLPIKLFEKFSSWFDGSNDKNKQDWVSSALQAILPVAFNKFFFQKSGFIVKILAALASQNAATLINKNTITNWITKLTQWIRKESNHKDEKYNMPDFGIPPDSETY